MTNSNLTPMDCAVIEIFESAVKQKLYPKCLTLIAYVYTRKLGTPNTWQKISRLVMKTPKIENKFNSLSMAPQMGFNDLEHLRPLIFTKDRQEVIDKNTMDTIQVSFMPLFDNFNTDYSLYTYDELEKEISIIKDKHMISDNINKSKRIRKINKL